jgi:hypothetical protein
MPTQRRRRVGAVLLVLAATIGLGACGGGGGKAASTTTTTRPSGSKLTGVDAERIAGILFRNVRDGGAAVTVAFDYQPTVSVTMAGRVDFAGHTGRLTITTRGAGGVPDVQKVAYSQDTVYEQPTAAQHAALVQAQRPGVQWLSRPPQPDRHPLDRVIDLLVKLAATRPDNPRLVAQGGTTFDRTEQVAGRPADVYATGKGASYWIDRRTGRLVRFSAQLAGFAGPVQIDLSDPGRRPAVVVPSGPSVLPLAQLPPPS